MEAQLGEDSKTPTSACDVLICIPSCTKNSERVEAVRDTWLRNFEDSAVVFVGGAPEAAPRNVVRLSCRDEYEYLPHKTLAAVRYCIAHFRFRLLFKCDDDTFVHGPDFRKLVAGLDVHYGGHIYRGKGSGDFHRAHHMTKVDGLAFRRLHRGKWRGPWCKGGTGYFLSKTAAEIVSRYASPPDAEELYEDKMIGDILRQHHIQPVHVRIPSQHPVMPVQMRALYSKLTHNSGRP